MKKRNMLVVVSLALMVTMGSVVFASGRAEARPIVWRIVVPSNPGQPMYELTVELLQNRIAAETNGRMQIQLHSETEMGTSPEIVENIRAGAVEMHWQAFAVTAMYVREFEFTSLPFIFSSREHLSRFLGTDAGQALIASAEKYGVYLWGPDLIGYRMPVARNRLFRTPDDLAGFRMRTMENQLQIDTMSALGANPVVLPYGEVYQGLGSGLIDGFFNDRNAFEYLSIHEVAPYYTELPLFSLGLSLAVSKEQFDALPADLQETVRRIGNEAAKAVLDAQWNYNIEETEWKTKLFRDFVIVDDVKPFVNAVQPVYDKFLSNSPENRKFLDAVEAVR